MSEWLLHSFHFYLPALAANLSLYLLWAFFGRSIVMPSDFGGRWGEQRIIGDGRGLSGLPTVLIVAGLVGGLQGRPTEAFYLALGVSLGTILNSFIKRRLGMKRGQPWRPWDQIDFILGASMVYALAFPLTLSTLVGGLLVGGTLHYAASLVLRPLLDPPEPEV